MTFIYCIWNFEDKNEKENFRAWCSQEMMYYTNETTEMLLLNQQGLS